MLRFQVLCDICAEPHERSNDQIAWGRSARDDANRDGWMYDPRTGKDVCRGCLMTIAQRA